MTKSVIIQHGEFWPRFLVNASYELCPKGEESWPDYTAEKLGAKIYKPRGYEHVVIEFKTEEEYAWTLLKWG